MTEPRVAPLHFVPAPGRSPMARIIRRQAAMEVTLTLRRGESLLLTLVIPVLLLVGVANLDALRLPTGDRVGFLVPGVLALAVMSTAFTAQAISTGYERSYGVLKRLGASALPRWGLLVAKSLAVLAVLGLQVSVLCAVGLLLGWRPQLSGAGPALALVTLGTAAFSGLALLMAGTLRAEATLAGANLVYLLLLAAGGVVVPLSSLPAGVRTPLEWLPITALADGLRAVLADGAGAAPVRVWIVLGLWAVGGIAVAARLFRWE
jgi:ABC-2 type transport system permease protein